MLKNVVVGFVTLLITLTLRFLLCYVCDCVSVCEVLF